MRKPAQPLCYFYSPCFSLVHNCPAVLDAAAVKTHLVHIFGKLGVDNRTSAIAVAAQRRIIRAPGQ
jgi:hypothetical protein